MWEVWVGEDFEVGDVVSAGETTVIITDTADSDGDWPTLNLHGHTKEYIEVHTLLHAQRDGLTVWVCKADLINTLMEVLSVPKNRGVHALCP